MAEALHKKLLKRILFLLILSKTNTMSFKLLFLTCILFFSCSKVIHLADTSPASIKIEKAAVIEPDAEIVAMIEPYSTELDKEMNQVIGSCAKDLTKAKPESKLGNWMADLIHKKSEAYYGKPIDLALVNYGGIRIPTLSQGEISKRTIFELMPFDNMLVVLHVDASTMLQLFERMAEYGGWPVSHQVKYIINNDQPEEITIHGKPIDENKIYTIALSDFIANGGDKCFFFEDKKREMLGRLFRDALIEGVEDLQKEGKQVDGEIEGRVILK